MESLYQELRQHNIELISDPGSFDVQDLLEKFEQLGIDKYLSNLPDHSDSDLAWLYLSVSSIVLYDAGNGLRDALRAVFEELAKREALKSDQVSFFYRHLVRAGELDDARAFAHEYDHLLEEPLPVIPEVVDGGYDPDIGPSVLRVLTPDSPLVRENLELYDDVTIIVQFDPQCGFSNSLMTQMATDDNAQRFISARAYLLATQPTDILRLDAFHAWNESSPFEVFLVENLSDWPFITLISTPSFYVLREGQEVESFDGYTSETLERLVEIAYEVVGESSPN